MPIIEYMYTAFNIVSYFIMPDLSSMVALEDDWYCLELSNAVQPAVQWVDVTGYVLCPAGMASSFHRNFPSSGEGAFVNFRHKIGDDND